MIVIKIFFIYSKEDKTFEVLAGKIAETMKKTSKEYEFFKHVSCLENEEQKSDINGIHLLMFNDFKNLIKYRSNYNNAKHSLLITDNLSAAFLLDSLKFVNDICYAKNNVELIVKKIMSSYNEQTRRNNVGKRRICSV